jgi:hypothetical protein
VIIIFIELYSNDRIVYSKLSVCFAEMIKLKEIVPIFLLSLYRATYQILLSLTSVLIFIDKTVYLLNFTDIPIKIIQIFCYKCFKKRHIKEYFIIIVKII